MDESNPSTPATPPPPNPAAAAGSHVVAPQVRQTNPAAPEAPPAVVQAHGTDPAPTTAADTTATLPLDTSINDLPAAELDPPTAIPPSDPPATIPIVGDPMATPADGPGPQPIEQSGEAPPDQNPSVAQLTADRFGALRTLIAAALFGGDRSPEDQLERFAPDHTPSDRERIGVSLRKLRAWAFTPPNVQTLDADQWATLGAIVLGLTDVYFRAGQGVPDQLWNAVLSSLSQLSNAANLLGDLTRRTIRQQKTGSIDVSVLGIVGNGNDGASLAIVNLRPSEVLPLVNLIRYARDEVEKRVMARPDVAGGNSGEREAPVASPR